MALKKRPVKLVLPPHPTGDTRHEQFAMFLRRGKVVTAAEQKELVDRMKADAAKFGQNSHVRRSGVEFLLDNPDLMTDLAMVPFIYRVLQDYHEKIPGRPLSGKEVAEFVDDLVGFYKMPLKEARQFAADETQKSPEAVKQLHLTYGRMIERKK